MLRLPALLIGSLLAFSSTPSGATSPLFPKPPELVPRVEFWKRIYTEVDTSGGLVHDARNVEIVYETIRFPSGLSSRSRDRKTREAKDRYKSILRTLASGKRSDLSADQKRVLALFPQGVSNQTLRTASGQVRFQLGQADKFRDGLVRMGRWENYIRQVLSARGLPTELVALPHVESSFNPKAHSHAGASGIWQFTRSTGRRYLRVDYVVDERRDPFLATIAAARLLKANHETTKTWPLAITAYNHGASGGGTRGPQARDPRHRRHPGPLPEPQLRLCLAQLLHRVPRGARGGGGSPEVLRGVRKDAPEDPEIVVLDHFYRAKTLASTFGITIEALRTANPALLGPDLERPEVRAEGLRPASAPRSPARRRPGDAGADSRRRALLGAGPRSAATGCSGATPSPPSRDASTSSQSELMALNNLRNRNHIRIGQVLNLPVKDPYRAVARTADPNRVPEPIPADGLYRVRRGDNITEIAQRFGVGVKDLLAVNHIRDRNRISVGQVLQLPGGANTARTSPTGGASPGVYTVRRGDTLDKISRRFGVTQDAIVALNGLRNRHQIRQGQTLFIPGGGEAATPEAAGPPPQSPRRSRTQPAAKRAIAAPASADQAVRPFGGADGAATQLRAVRGAPRRNHRGPARRRHSVTSRTGWRSPPPPCATGTISSLAPPSRSEPASSSISPGSRRSASRNAGSPTTARSSRTFYVDLRDRGDRGVRPEARRLAVDALSRQPIDPGLAAAGVQPGSRFRVAPRRTAAHHSQDRQTAGLTGTFLRSCETGTFLRSERKNVPVSQERKNVPARGYQIGSSGPDPQA